MKIQCTDARLDLLDQRHADLSRERAAELERHLERCPDCRAHAAAEQALTEALQQQLPRFSAPERLVQRLAAVHAPALGAPRPILEPAPAPPMPSPEPAPRRAPTSAPARRWRSAWAPFVAAAATLALASVGSHLAALDQERTALAGEVVNDHLRMLEGAPLSQVTGGLHEVKPWFSGKLEFAPAVRFAGDADFPLQGGAVERFLDRRAAVFVYKRRQHTVSLFVVRSEGLAFPSSGRPVVRTDRGFSVVLWTAHGQGFALASDTDPSELSELAHRLEQSR